MPILSGKKIGNVDRAQRPCWCYEEEFACGLYDRAYVRTSDGPNRRVYRAWGRNHVRLRKYGIYPQRTKMPLRLSWLQTIYAFWWKFIKTCCLLSHKDIYFCSSENWPVFFRAMNEEEMKQSVLSDLEQTGRLEQLRAKVRYEVYQSLAKEKIVSKKELSNREVLTVSIISDWLNNHGWDSFHFLWGS